jgi:hypothetical protein
MYLLGKKLMKKRKMRYIETRRFFPTQLISFLVSSQADINITLHNMHFNFPKHKINY